MFCKTFSATHGWSCETFEINEDNQEHNIIPQQKTNRYYLSSNGVRFRKIKEERKIEIEANKKVKIFNKFFEASMEEYDVDYQYYIDECYKIIHTIDGTLERIKQEKKEERERIKKEKEEENFLKYCVNKIPTERQYELYKRDWLIEKYGEPNEVNYPPKAEPMGWASGVNTPRNRGSSS